MGCRRGCRELNPDLFVKRISRSSKAFTICLILLLFLACGSIEKIVDFIITTLGG